MEFRKYNSIENSYQEKFIGLVKQLNFDVGEYIVQEKVHGSNLSFTTNGTEIKSAKRSEYLAEEENFHNYQAVRDKYKSNIIKTFELVKELHPETEHITIFGEIFGGSYAHAEVPKDAKASKVQKGVFYCPHNDFYVFDILVNNEFYLTVEAANEIFEKAGLFYAKTLLKGNFEECLAYPNNFESKIAEWFGLPLIGNNICEGVVIKPNETRFLPNGTRVIIKNKNEKWTEKAHAKSRSSEPKEEIELSEKAIKLKDEIFSLITENRLSNVISKIGEVSFKDFGKLVGLFSVDVLEEFNKEYEEEFKSLEKAEAKNITKFLNNEASDLIRRELRKMM